VLQQQHGHRHACTHDSQVQRRAANWGWHPSIKHPVVDSADVRTSSQERDDRAGLAAPDGIVQGGETAEIALVDKPACGATVSAAVSTQVSTSCAC
jgi:hypothetical protein